MRLTRNFFNRNTVTVAKELLGKILVRKVNGRKLAGIIVETEAYRGEGDAGSHAYRKVTRRNSIMFGPPGHAYVYFCYGNHYMLNFVTERNGKPGAVLIRAIEPVLNIKEMIKKRKITDIHELANGPGKLTQALAIGKKENGLDVIKSREIFVEEPKKKRKFKIICTSRVGIKQGLDKKWRFYIKDSEFVSK